MDAGLYVTVVATETDFAFLWKMAEKHLGTVGVTLTMSVAVDAVLQAHSKYNLRVILQSVVKDLCGAVSFAFHPD